VKTYATEATAFRRQHYLATNYGIFTGVQKCGNRYRLLHDPEDWELGTVDVLFT
jgi:hypothetical protein